MDLARDFRYVWKAADMLSWKKKDKISVWRILAAILHLGR